MMDDINDVIKYTNEYLIEHEIFDYFDDPSYIPSKDEFSTFTEEQKDYLMASVIEDINDICDLLEQLKYKKEIIKSYIEDNK